MSVEKKDLYIGKTKIKEYHIHEDIDLVSVMMENEKTYDYTHEQFENVAREEAYDDMLEASYKWESTMKKIIKLLTNNRANLADTSFVLGRIKESIDGSLRKSLLDYYNVVDEHEVLLYEIDVKLRGKEEADKSFAEKV